MDDKDKLEYCKFATGVVIAYAREQGVKLRYSDFPIDGKKNNQTENEVFFIDGENPIVLVFISNNGRWAAQLKKAQDGFLDYVNARVLKTGVKFIFSLKELDFLKMKNENVGPDDIEKVIRKITKLLALADLEKNPEESEAIAASLAAQRLLAKYNLSLADVTGEHRPEEDVEQVIADVGTGNKWKYELADTVANNYACKAYSRGSEMIIFFGYKADVIIARRVFVYLFKVGNRLANQYVKKHREQSMGCAAGVYNSFVSGFTAGVRRELEKQCTALALVIQPKVQETWDIFSEHMRAVDRTVEAIDGEAYEEGVVEGKRALNAQYLEEGKTDT